MINFKKNNLYTYQLFIVIISLSFWVYLLGIKFISPINQDWLSSGDLSMYQISWNYFKNDIWRFPLSLNPNFGIYAGGSLVFSDSIPILGIIFKTISTYLPFEFQYFSLWILLCIYLQLFFSFKILHKLTNDPFYSLIGALFFCFATIFINRTAIHLGLSGHWLILFSFYIEILESRRQRILRIFVILLSCTIHFYFTIILIILNFIIQVFSFFKKQKKKTTIIKELLTTYTLLLILMYVIGYFSIQVQDGLGAGFGYYNMNLNSFFNPVGSNNFNEFNWSYFLSEQKKINGEKEGFAFLGISGLVFLVILIINLRYKKYEVIFVRHEFLAILIIFFLLSISNNINLGEKNLISIPLNNLTYGIFSSIRASGRLIWPVYYLILIFGIFFIHKFFKNNKAYLILIFLFIIQMIDIHPGLLQYKFGSQYLSKSNNDFIKDGIWKNLSGQYDELRLIEPMNSSNIYQKMKKYLLKEKFIKTDVFYLARANRKNIPYKKYELIENFNNKDLSIFSDRLFVSDDFYVVQNIYSLYGDKLFYYFRDDLWLISNEIINQQKPIINQSILSKYQELNLGLNNKVDLDKLIGGLGWSKKLSSEGLVSDGYFSTIIFKTNKENCNQQSKINFSIERFFPYYKEPIRVNIFVNQIKEKTIIIDKNFINEVNFGYDCNSSNNFIIDFQIENPISLYDLRKGLNRYKRSIILKSITINK